MPPPSIGGPSLIFSPVATNGAVALKAETIIAAVNPPAMICFALTAKTLSTKYLPPFSTCSRNSRATDGFFSTAPNTRGMSSAGRFETARTAPSTPLIPLFSAAATIRDTWPGTLAFSLTTTSSPYFAEYFTISSAFSAKARIDSSECWAAFCKTPKKRPPRFIVCSATSTPPLTLAFATSSPYSLAACSIVLEADFTASSVSSRPLTFSAILAI